MKNIIPFKKDIIFDTNISIEGSIPNNLSVTIEIPDTPPWTILSGKKNKLKLIAIKKQPKTKLEYLTNLFLPYTFFKISSNFSLFLNILIISSFQVSVYKLINSSI